MTFLLPRPARPFSGRQPATFPVERRICHDLPMSVPATDVIIHDIHPLFGPGLLSAPRRQQPRGSGRVTGFGSRYIDLNAPSIGGRRLLTGIKADHATR
jgi:hypothetical protein